MKVRALHIVRVLLALLFFAGVGFILHFSSEERASKVCTGISVEFSDSLKFVSQDDIKNYISSNYGAVTGQRLDSVKLDKLERLLESKSAILDSQAWTGEDGVLHITLSQRAPELRFSNSDSGYYIDRDGYVFPLHKSYTADVPVIYGNVPKMPAKSYKGPAPDELDRQWFTDMLAFKEFVSRRKRGGFQLDSIWVTGKGDLMFTLEGKPEKFVFGDLDDFGEKFAKIDDFYAYIKPEKPDTEYKVVNLKYKKQIICRQKDI